MPDATLIRRAIVPLGRVLDFGGRSRRADFWPYMGLLMALYLAMFAIGFSDALSFIHRSFVVLLFGFVGILVLLAFAATVRRLHDVGWSGRWMAAYVAMVIAFVAVFFYWRHGLVEAAGGPPPIPLMRMMPILMIFTAMMNGIALLVLVLCLQEGTTGPNRYGPDPKGRSAH